MTRSAAARLAPLAVLVLGLALFLAFDLGRFLSLDGLAARRGALAVFVAERPVLAALGFVLLYVALVALLVPAATLLTLAGGLVFGWRLGGALSVVGATVGALVLFLAARHAVSDAAAGLLRRRAGDWVGRLAEGFRRDAFGYLLVLRLTPVVPFFALNIAPAFLGVPLRTVALTTFIGILPGTFVYAFLGDGLDGALAAAARAGTSPSLSDLVTTEARVALLGLAALALLGLLLKNRLLRGRGRLAEGGAAAPEPERGRP